MILETLLTKARRCPSVVIFKPPSSQPPTDNRTGRSALLSASTSAMKDFLDCTDWENVTLPAGSPIAKAAKMTLYAGGMSRNRSDGPPHVCQYPATTRRGRRPSPASFPESGWVPAGTAVRAREMRGAAESAGKTRAVTRIATAAPATIAGQASSADLRRCGCSDLSGQVVKGFSRGLRPIARSSNQPSRRTATPIKPRAMRICWVMAAALLNGLDPSRVSNAAEIEKAGKLQRKIVNARPWTPARAARTQEELGPAWVCGTAAAARSRHRHPTASWPRVGQRTEPR